MSWPADLINKKSDENMICWSQNTANITSNCTRVGLITEMELQCHKIRIGANKSVGWDFVAIKKEPEQLQKMRTLWTLT